MSSAVAPDAPPSPVPTIPVECLPNYDLIVTEDDTPVDNIFSERQATLLKDPLYASWQGPGEGRPFVAMGNVGLFYAIKRPPLVPDFLLSLDVEPVDDLWPKENRSYFIWNTGKAPDLIAEFVSNTEGGEADIKRQLYARIGVLYYVIFDPLNQLGDGVLRTFSLRGRTYDPVAPDLFPEIGLGLTLQDGLYEGYRAEWLRWRDQSGNLLPTSRELADQECQRADQERQRANQECQRANQECQRADQERQRADEERQRAERLAAQLKALNIEPTK